MWNEPTKDQLSKLPKLYETEKVPLKDKPIYLHFFIGDCDWFISEYDGEDLFFGYAIIGNPEFAEWVDKNKWYETSQPMRAYADALGRDLAYKGLAPGEVLKEVERQVRDEFPQKFRNANRDKPGAVESSTNKGVKGNNDVALSDDERRVMQRFVRTGVMTEKEYMVELKRIKGA